MRVSLQLGPSSLDFLVSSKKITNRPIPLSDPPNTESYNDKLIVDKNINPYNSSLLR